MAKIFDPDLLNRGTEIVLDFSVPTARTIRLVSTGNLDSSGVTLQAVYSKLKELWRSASDLPAIPFPMTAITSEQYDLVNGWDWYDNTSRYLIRDAGWSVRDSSNTLLQSWAGIVSLGSLGSSDQVYYQQVAGGSTTNFQLTGAVNQAIQVYKSGSGAFDYRTYLKLFARIQGKLYAQASLTDVGITSIDYRRNTFPLANAADPKVTHLDATISSTTPYTGMSITYLAGTGFTTWTSGQAYAIGAVVQYSNGRWYTATSAHTASAGNNPTSGSPPWSAYTGERQIGTAYYPYNVIIAGNNGTAEQIYEYEQYQLRQSTDIDAGSGVVTGKTADVLLKFTGDNLATTTGVYIDGFNTADINRITFTDATGSGRAFPYTAAGTILFNSNLSTDSSAKYWLYFNDPSASTGDEFGTGGAIIINDASGNPITGNVPQQAGGSSLSFTFAYDSNSQGGRTPATDAAFVAVAIGLGTGKYTSTTGTLTRSISNSVPLSAELERSYSNP